MPIADDRTQHARAEDFLDALLSSADAREIGPSQWWPRAVSALETAGATSTTFRQATARACRRLQIHTLSEPSSAAVAALANVLDDPAEFSRWRTVARRDSIAIAAMVRHRRSTRTKEEPTNE